MEEVKVDLVGKEFQITTNNEKFKTVVIEKKNPSEFINWFNKMDDEIKKINLDLERLNKNKDEMLKPNKAEEEIRNKIKDDANKCRTLDELKSWLVDVISGKLQKNEQIGNLIRNIKYLEDKKKNISLTQSRLNKYLIKAKRLVK